MTSHKQATAINANSKIVPANKAFDHTKYQPFAFAPKLTDRTWPDKKIVKAPIWASVDLRDGNQALIDPMTIEQKLRFFKLLVKMGFKEIEIGFPSAAQVEFDFARKLIEENHVPEDVTLQVLVQAREHLIRRTFESLEGAKQAVVHVYNSTSKVQRDKVYQKSRNEIKQIAVNGATLVREIARDYPNTQWTFQYSPESFSQTETDYAVEVCDAVCKVWQPEDGQAVILNLPATVEASTPNIFADQVEYFCRHLPQRADVIISLHTHNDRGCGVAAAELGLMAGADRIEGTLLGNGERTGNMDILVTAMNMYSQGVDPELDFSNVSEMAQIVSECNNLPVHPRHPYVGELVFTAFSGSHQDAIKKSLDFNVNDNDVGETESNNESNNECNNNIPEDFWDVAYLPIDPSHIGRGYQDVVRINSQSGKGGVAYILERDYGFKLPRWMQIDFSRVVQTQAESLARELKNDEILQMFETAYLQQKQLVLQDFSVNDKSGCVSFTGNLLANDVMYDLKGEGNGSLSAFISALSAEFNKPMHVMNFSEHVVNTKTSTKDESFTDASAAAYIQLNVDGNIYSGIGVCTSILTATLKAALSALVQSM